MMICLSNVCVFTLAGLAGVMYRSSAREVGARKAAGTRRAIYVEVKPDGVQCVGDAKARRRG